MDLQFEGQYHFQGTLGSTLRKITITMSEQDSTKAITDAVHEAEAELNK